MTCPIIKSINEVNNRLLICGGLDDDPLLAKDNEERICDDMLYYINMRFIELARMKVGKLDINSARVKYDRMFGEYVGKDIQYMKKKLSSMSLAKKMLTVALANARKVVNEFEKLVAEKVFKLARDGKPINISLGDFVDGDSIDSVNSLVLYTSMDIGSLVENAPKLVRSVVVQVPKDEIDNGPLPKLSSLTIVDDYLRTAEEYLNLELKIINYLLEREKMYIFALAQVRESMQYLANLMPYLCKNIHQNDVQN